MSKFDSRLETGYKRVVDVVEDFVVEATKAMECKRLPRSILATGQYTGSSFFNANYPTSQLVEEFFWKMFLGANSWCLVVAAGGNTREPHFMVPFRRNEDFVGRGYVLEKLEKNLTARRDYQPRVALWGLGGVG